MNTFPKPLALILGVLLLASAFCQTLQAQPAPVEDARIARLAGLAKVWGTVKYFHPYLAYRDIDWDKALIETIPKVNAAKTAQDYEASINQMLAVLNDKSTRAEIDSETKPTGPSPSDAAKLVRSENGVLIIEFANQLRDEGLAVDAAIREAAARRLRPIVMTSLATVAGASGPIDGDHDRPRVRRARRRPLEGPPRRDRDPQSRRRRSL